MTEPRHSADFPAPSDGLVEWFSALVEQSLAPSERAQLERRLRDDREARRAYVKYIHLHAALARYAGNTPTGPIFAGERKLPAAAADAAPASSAISASTGRKTWLRAATTRGAGIFRRVTPLSLLIAFFATSLMLAFMAMVAAPLFDRQTPQIVEEDPGPAPPEWIARIRRQTSPVWSSDRPRPAPGKPLPPGEPLDLQSGLVEIEFRGGARVVLQGPARFAPHGVNMGHLTLGQLTARVPPQAVGFRVTSPRLEVVDLGTEFGIEVETGGAAEVHVFAGRVKTISYGEEQRPGHERELGPSQGLRVEAGRDGDRAREIPVDREKFLKGLPPFNAGPGRLLAYENFGYPPEPIDGKRGGSGWAGAWEIEVGRENPAWSSVREEGLEYEGVTQRGGRLTQWSNDHRVARKLDVSERGPFARAGLIAEIDGRRLIGAPHRRVYLGFLQQIDRRDGVFYGVGLARGDGDGHRVLSIGRGARHTPYGVSTETGLPDGEPFAPLDEENFDVNWIVVRVTFGEAGRGKAEVFRNPPPGAEESQLAPQAVLEGDFAFERVVIGNFNGLKSHQVDEIRIGNSWEAVK